MNLLKALPVLVIICTYNGTVLAQNVGIGTTNPQNKLHVAGGIRVDNLAGPAGIVTKNTAGDFGAAAFTNSSNHVLRGDGTFGTLNGLLPATGIATSKIYNNTALINAGYSLIGEIPAVTSYTTTSTTFAANTEQPTYTRGIAANVSPPEFGDTGEPPLAVWSGSLMYVWEGTSIYAYSPDTDIWVVEATGVLAEGAYGDCIAWTGTEIILWKAASVYGERYNPASNTSTIMSVTNAPSARIYNTALWTGSRLILWGGSTPDGITPLNTGAVYNPTTNTWTAITTTGAPAARGHHTAVWATTNSRMLIWGGSTAVFSGELNTGGSYDLATNTWSAITTTGAPSARNYQTAVWAGSDMYIVGGRFNASAVNSGARYNPVTNTWAAISTSGVPALYEAAAVWTGSEIYLSGGYGATASNGLYSYNPATNTWTFAEYLSSGGRLKHRCFYIFNMIVSWGGLEVLGQRFSNEGSRYFLSNTASSATTLTTGPLYLYQKN